MKNVIIIVKGKRDNMLNIIKAIVFGIIEGITEWLPISSTGHLILAERILGFEGLSAGFWDMFEVVIQLGAILAVVVLYFKNIWPLKYRESKHGGRELKFDKDILNLWGKIIVACVPAILIVVLKLDEWADAHFYNPTCIAIMLIVVGIAFIVIESTKRKEPRVNSIKDLTYKDAIIIGIFQIIAGLFPGTSRSGATIIGALLIGISREVAAEYTFYLAIPAMAGASLLKVLKFGLAFTSQELIALIVGTFISFIVSIVVIKFFMNYIRKHDFKVFGWYRIALGIIVLILVATNIMC